ncbi:hypothetical protein DAEQUDRAFT_660618 [Daedalea quercina L-15889]|uniref:Uncharacterized protein n=1 Tax=Daedalea quercina L-15889 TaxID=1314783 RepID=A0A165U832_9APHY|nr:hypothetical protein DAEQUDRAFT_660618 [Daedalea quercina L-15889]
MLLEPQALATALLPIHGRPKPLKSSIAPPTLSRDSSFDLDLTVTPGPLTRTSSEVEPPPSAVVSRSSSDSSLSSSSALSVSPPVSEQDVVSLFDSGATTSTRITTPHDSAMGSVRPSKSDEGHNEAITIISTSRKIRPLSIDLSPSTLPPPAFPRYERRHSQPTSPLRTDEDWARDVRWLVPPGSSPTAPNRVKPSPSADSPVRLARPLHPDLLPPLSPDALPIPAPHQLERQAFPDLTSVAGPPAARPRSKEQRNSRHSSHRHSKTRMSALWEEDESEYSDWGASSADVSRASTPAPMPYAEGYMNARGSTASLGWAYAGMGATSGPVVTSGVGAVGHGPLHPEFRNSLHRRPSMSESDLFERFKRDPESPSLSASPDVKFQDYAIRRRRNHLRSVSLSNPSAPSLGQQVSFSSSLPTHSIPAPFPISEPGHGSGSVGYTSLTLPHAAYTGKSGKTRLDGHVDLVRSGKAQSSMATIEIVRGVASSVGSSPLAKTRRRLSFSIGKNKRDKESETPAHLRATLPLPVAFMAHIPPPTFVSTDHILVQVFAVGLDALDSLVVQEKAQKGGFAGSVGGKKRGFIPGRSFVGRAVECGFDVDGAFCKRGEWVVGLLDVRKCGALAEYVIIERHRMRRCKKPLTKGATLFPPRQRTRTRTLSSPSLSGGASVSSLVQSSVSSSPLPNQLTPRELALIPLCGLPAHRAVRSFAEVIAARKGKGGRARILVLNAHDGAGAMALQMLAKKKVNLCAQIPRSAVREVEESEDSSESGTSTSSLTRRERVETRVRGYGAEEIFVGEPLAILEQLFDAEGSFDGVLDTVGGVAIWEAAQRLLASYPSMSCAVSDAEDGEDGGQKRKRFVCPAQFTTLVGDMPSRAIPSANDNIRLGLRSLRRAVSTSEAPAKGSGSKGSFGRKRTKVKRMVGYAWVSVAADVDEGEDVRDSLAAVVEMVEGNKVKPWVGVEEDEDRVVTFERAPEVFRRDADGPRGVLQDAGTCVVKIGAWS